MSLNFLKGIGNQHIEVVRLGLFLGIIAYIGLAGWHLYSDHTFSALEFSTGFGLLLGAGAGGTALKDTAVVKATNAQGEGQ